MIIKSKRATPEDFADWIINFQKIPADEFKKQVAEGGEEMKEIIIDNLFGILLSGQKCMAFMCEKNVHFGEFGFIHNEDLKIFVKKTLDVLIK